jgi:hypothetical protein
MGAMVSTVGRGLSRDDRRALGAISRFRTEAAVTAARIDAIAAVTQTALIDTADVASTQAILVTRTPHAAGWLAYVAETGVLRMAGEVRSMGHA